MAGKMCKHQNCTIYEKFTVNSEIMVTEGIPGKTVEAIQPLFPTGRILVICRDCNMKKVFGAGWPKWLQRGIWIGNLDVPELHSTTTAVLGAIKAFWAEEGFSPSIRDIMEATGITSTSVVSYHIVKLERAGAIKRTPGIARSYVLIEGR